MSIYLKINDIPGAVTTKGYEGCIEVFNYHLKTQRGIHQKPGAVVTRTSGLLHFSSLILTKQLDKSSSTLLTYFYEAKVIRQADFYHLATGSLPKCSLVNTFYGVMIGCYREMHTDDKTIEKFTLHFIKQAKRISPIDNEGNETTPEMVGFDLLTVQTL